MDCRKELKEGGAIIIDDAAVAPDVGDVGGISHGQVSAVDCEMHRFDRRFD